MMAQPCPLATISEYLDVGKPAAVCAYLYTRSAVASWAPSPSPCISDVVSSESLGPHARVLIWGRRLCCCPHVRAMVTADRSPAYTFASAGCLSFRATDLIPFWRPRLEGVKLQTVYCHNHLCIFEQIDVVTNARRDLRIKLAAMQK